jgi:hypothetical protein
MKNLLFFALLLSISIIACKKETIEEVNEPIAVNPTDVEVAKGTFVSNAHTTTGTVKVIEDANKKKFLVFENFKTDPGPALRIYLATNTSATNFTEVSNTVNNGNYQLEIPATADLANQKYVLIWCKQFSVLFGNAQLQ